jgi:hypothetical protein
MTTATAQDQPHPARRRRRHPTFSRMWHRDALNLCVELTGLPALVSVITSFLTSDQKILAASAVSALLIAIGLRFFPRITETHALRLVIPWLLVVGLALVLLLVLVVQPRRTASLSQQWLDWQRSLEKSVGGCSTLNGQPLEDCLSRTLSDVLPNRPKVTAHTAQTELARSVMAGQVLLANELVRQELSDRLSVDNRFIGTGNSEPVDDTSPASARIPEYLVPNLPETHDWVWVWEVGLSDMLAGTPVLDHSLRDVLQNETSQPADFKSALDWITKDHLGVDDSSALVRFAILEPKGPIFPSGCLGKPRAKRVFMNSLSPLLDLPLAKAAVNSGYTKEQSNPNARLYIWVFVPTEDVQPVRATWENVLDDMPAWIEDADCSRPKAAQKN